MGPLLAAKRLRTNKARSPHSPARRGFSLVELLVVLLVSVFVVGAALTIYQVNVRYYIQQDSLLEQTQNLRVAMYTVARDVRMAGNCFTLMGTGVKRIQAYIPAIGDQPAGWFRYSSGGDYGALPVFGLDGGTGGTDSLTIFRADIESASPVGQLANAYTPGGSSVRLDFIEPFGKGTLEDGDIVALVNDDRAMLLEAGGIDSLNRAYATIGGRFRPDSGKGFPGGDYTFPRGTYVYNLRDITLVTYQVDGDLKALVANYHDGGLMGDNIDKDNMVIVANNIEDFQVRYWISTGAALTVTPLEGDDSISEGQLADGGNWIKAVNLAMSAISPTVDQKRGLNSPQPLFNHSSVGPPDRHLRRSLAETVYLRNF